MRGEQEAYNAARDRGMGVTEALAFAQRWSDPDSDPLVDVIAWKNSATPRWCSRPKCFNPVIHRVGNDKVGSYYCDEHLPCQEDYWAKSEIEAHL